MRRTCERTGAQLGLGLPAVEIPDAAMRAAYGELALPLPFERAMRSKALAICVRNFVEARRRQGR